MERYLLDDCLPVIAIDVAAEEKARIAEMATATLRKLHNVMRRMKSWRDDSAKLKSNIWRMKMALRAGDKNGNDNREIDPLIVHQRAEISRLEEANDALGHEVASLKGALTRAEEDIAGRAARDETGGTEDDDGPSGARRRDRGEALCRKQPAVGRLTGRLEEFARGDRVLEVILANAIGRTVETVVSLSEELVNANEEVYRFKTKNGNLHRKLDRLRAMLRLRSGSVANYRKRIGELNDLAARLTGEMGRLKIIRDGGSGVADLPDVVAHVARLMNELKDRLKSEREALLAAGDPDRLRYMKKVVGLKVSLKVLAVELRRSTASLGDERYARTVSSLDDFLTEIGTEIGKLKVTPADEYCRIGGVSGIRYMAKIAELEKVVRRSATAIGVLRRREPSEAAERVEEELSDAVEQLCRKMQDLEVFDDRANLRERLSRLEVTIVRLRLELAEKDDECTGIKLTLENDRDEHERLVAEARRENELLRDEMSELSRSRLQLERRVVNARLMALEIDTLRKKLRELGDEKETLSGQTARMRDILRERDEEMADIISGRDSLKAVLGAEVKDLKTKLEIAADENAKLRSIIGGLGKRRRELLDKLKSSASKSDVEDNGGGGPRRDRSPASLELERLRAESNESEISWDEAGERVERLRRALDEAVGDRARLQDEVSALKSNEESLTYRLDVEASAGERTTEANKALEGEVKHLRREKEQLEAELSELRAEKGSLGSSVIAADNECAALQDRIHGLELELGRLREEAKDSRLERTLASLEDATGQVTRLEAEISKVSGGEPSTERNEPTTRINEADDEDAGLHDRSNKARPENEYFSMELNKSRVENDKVEVKSAPLPVTCDRVASEARRRRLNETGDRRREIPRTAGENNDRVGREGAIDARRSPVVKGREERGAADAHRKLRRELDCSDAARAGVKVEIGERKDDERAFKAGPDICTSPDNKARIKDKPKGRPKRPRAENKALKSEPTNFGPGYVRHAGAMVAAPYESKSPIRPATGEPAGPVVTSGRRELVNIRYTRRMSNCAGHSGDSEMLRDKVESRVSDIDRLGVENRAPKMEVDIPRRDGLDFGPTDGESARIDPEEATEEILALKSELRHLREEKAALRSRLEAFGEELDGLGSERAALKGELVATRKSNFDLRLKVNGLRHAVEKLRETNARLEGGLRSALRETNERGAVSEASDGSSGNIFRNIDHAPENLRAIKKRLDRFEYVALKNSRVQSAEEDLQRVEGQK